MLISGECGPNAHSMRVFCFHSQCLHPKLDECVVYGECELGCQTGPKFEFMSKTAQSSSRLSLRVHHNFISLAAVLAVPLVCYANDRQPAYQPMQVLRRSNETHASFCSPPSALPCPNSSSPCSNCSCGITPKLHYTIALDARGIRRSGKVSLDLIRL
jgi:hypothetical protein